MMKKLGTLSWFLLLAIFLAVLTGLSAAQENPDPIDSNLAHKLEEDLPALAPPDSTRKLPESLGSTVELDTGLLDFQVARPSPSPFATAGATGQACGQLLANPAINVVEFGDGEGIAEPWWIYDKKVYYSDEVYESPYYSYVLVDADIDDPTPGQDAFYQSFFMPDNLTSVRIEYKTATLDTNNTDFTAVNIFTLNEDETLNQLVYAWNVGDSDSQWAWRYKEIEPIYLQDLQGEALAIYFFNITDGIVPGEWVFFDDITLEACVKSAPPASGKVFMPNVMHDFGKASGPICLPPNENPQDQYYANRGTVQTGATCKSSLSESDRADYYAFTPSQSGNHTLHLTDLPAGTKWAAMMFFDTASPSYVPGPTGDEKDCRIGTGGAVDKSVTCSLQKDVPLFVKVSAGSTPMFGDYTMKITGP